MIEFWTKSQSNLDQGQLFVTGTFSLSLGKNVMPESPLTYRDGSSDDFQMWIRVMVIFDKFGFSNIFQSAHKVVTKYFSQDIDHVTWSQPKFRLKNVTKMSEKLILSSITMTLALFLQPWLKLRLTWKLPQESQCYQFFQILGEGLRLL